VHGRATCLAMQPDLAAKEAAWAVPLSSGEPASSSGGYIGGHATVISSPGT
jgi:hypothetical protein